MGNDGGNVNILESLPPTGEDGDGALAPEDNESSGNDDGSDTSRVVDSATSYARFVVLQL